jgi:hypothetical protein
MAYKIKKEIITLYAIECDGPGKNGKGCNRMSEIGADMRDAETAAKNSSWSITKNKHLCPNCSKGKTIKGKKK